MNRPTQTLKRIAVTIGLLLLISSSRPALAGSHTPAGPSLTELRERERILESKRERALRGIEERLQAQTLDSGEALMERSRVDHDYRNELNAIRGQQDQAFRALEEKRKPAREGGSAGAPNSALPRIPSQSVVTYPLDGEPAPQETSQVEGRQKNVGLGTRELEF